MDDPTLNWEDINKGFVVWLPRTRRQNDSIWVIMDRLTKFAHFILVKSTYTVEEYERMYINEIVSIHGIPLSIISDRVSQFISHFWKVL